MLYSVSQAHNEVFHYKPSILGYHYFWKHPYMYTVSYLFISDVQLGPLNGTRDERCRKASQAG